MERQQVTKQPSDSQAAPVTTEHAQTSHARKPEHEALLDESDDLMAAIDEALLGVEEDLAINFRQQGGQ